MSRDSHGSITLSINTEVKVDKPLDETHDGNKSVQVKIVDFLFNPNELHFLHLGDESFKVEIMEYLIDASITVISFITRTSYIGTNIIMMVKLHLFQIM